jgi:hypothetical protein
METSLVTSSALWNMICSPQSAILRGPQHTINHSQRDLAVIAEDGSSCG